MGFHSAIKRNKLMVQITTAVNLRSITRSGRSQTQKATCLMKPSIQQCRAGRTTDKEIRLVLPGAVWGGRSLMTKTNGESAGMMEILS